tara:strand:+ start:401 stop:4318 length:3918 start_codon:yes stop_codon:yes gene_type:complete
MAKAKELYISLRDDPDLSIPEGETRESAAWNETSHRMRQHQSNAKALSMASEVSEPSSIEKFADFIEKAVAAKIPVGPFESKAAFDKALGFSFKGVKTTQASLNKIVSDLSNKEKINLAHNVHEYFNSATDEGEHDLHTEMSEWSSSLPEDEKSGLLKKLASTRKPFTANQSINAKELKDNGYIGRAATKGGHKLTVQGAAHLVSGKMKVAGKNNPFIISPANFKKKENLSDSDSWDAIAPEKFEPPKTTKQKQNQLARDLTDDGIFENEKTANKVIAGTTDDDTDFNAHYDKISDYHEELGGHPIKSSGSKGHIDNLNNNTTEPVRQHVPKEAKVTEDKPAEKPEEKFKAIQIYDQGRFTADDFDSEGKLKPALFEGDEVFADVSDAQKEHLQGITFESGKDYKKAGTEDGAKLKDVIKPKTETTPARRRRAPTTAAEQPKPKAAPKADVKKPATKKPATKKPADKAAADKAAADKAAKAAAEAKKPEVSVEQHKSIQEMVKVLGDKHVGKTTDASKSFNNFAGSKEDSEKWFKRMLRNELTKDDVALLGKHLQNNGEDLDDLRRKGISSDDTNYPLLAHGEQVAAQEAKVRTAAGQGDPPLPIKDETEIDGEGGEGEGEGEREGEREGEGEGEGEGIGDIGTGDTGVDAADKKDVEAEASGKEFDKLMGTDHGKQVLAHMYEETHGKDNPFTSPEEHKEALRADFIKNPTKEKTTYSKKWKASEKADSTAEEKAEKTEQTAKVKDLENRAAGSDLKMNKREAAALIEEHGDVDTAFDAHEKAFADKTKKQESANELPYTTDDLAKKIFGDVDPTSRLTHLSADRKKNKYGEVSTSLARELIAHYKTHSGVMDKKVEKELIEQLAFLKDPSKRFPNMRIPKGETIGADIKVANAMVKEAEEKGFALDGPEAGRLYEKREAERTRRVLHHQTAHVNPTTDENKKTSHGEGADPNEEKTGVFSKTDNNSSLHFDEDGNVTGRKRRGSDGEEQHESFKTDGSDDHHLRGDHEARGSRVKEHVVPSHGNHLDDKEKESLGSLKEAHKSKEDAVRSGDDKASTQADADIAQHTKDLEDRGLQQSDFLHDEDDRPKVGPPHADVAAHMRAQGLEWNEANRNWVSKEGDDERRGVKGSAGSSFSHVGDGASMGIFTAEMGADGVINQAHDTRTFVHSSAGYHAVDTNHDSIPSSNGGLQAQKFGQIGSIKSAAGKVGETGKTQMVAARDHSHLTAHGTHDSQPPDVFERAGSAAKKVAGGVSKVARVAANARRLIGIKKLIEEESDNLSSVQSLQLHIALQKLEEKQKTAV